MSTPNATTPVAPAAAGAAPAEGTAPAAGAAPAAAGAAATSTAPAAKGSVFAKELPAETKDAETKPADAPAPVELDLPEGFDAKAGETLKALAGRLGLDKTKGGELVKAYAEANAAAQKVAEERFDKQVTEWKTAAKADPLVEKLGGFEKVVRGADRLLTRFDTDGKLSGLLESSGLAFHPAVVGFFGQLAAALKEDTVTGAANTPGPSASQADEMARLKALYPKSPQMFPNLKE